MNSKFFTAVFQTLKKSSLQSKAILASTALFPLILCACSAQPALPPPTPVVIYRPEPVVIPPAAQTRSAPTCALTTYRSLASCAIKLEASREASESDKAAIVDSLSKPKR